MATEVEVKPDPTLKQSGSEGRFWLSFACGVILLLIVAATRWIFDHPYGIHWDEASYFNEALADLHKLHHGNLRQIASILIADPFRPPAYRLFLLPISALFGFHVVLARFVSLVCWLATAAIMYLTARRMASPVAGAIAVLLFCLAPEIFSASTFFSTEGPLLLATSAMLYFLCDYWTEETGPQHWIGLGLAISLGLLSKITFILIAFPILALTFVLYRRKLLSAQALTPFFKAGVLAFIIATPWWLKNIRGALHYSTMIRQEPRESFGAPSLLTSAKWFGSVVMGLLGPAVAVVICLVVIVTVRKIIIQRQVTLNSVQKTAAWACLVSGLPLVILQLSGMNHNLRYLTPAVIPLAIATGVLADATGWVRNKVAGGVICLLAVVQFAMLVAPVAFPRPYPQDPGLVNGGLPWGVMARFEQWDWRPLRAIADKCDLPRPKIAFLGMGRPLNPPQIAYPWFVDGTISSDDWFSRTPPQWLWWYSKGTPDWEKMMNDANQNDIVLTAPDFVGQVSDKQNLDNRYNREFAERLAADPHFRGPIHLKMGRFEPVEVTVFVRSDFSCQVPGEGQSTPDSARMTSAQP